MRKGMQMESTGRSLRTILLGALLACVLLAGAGASANASTTYEVRGEWTYVVTCTCEFVGVGGHSLPGKVTISKMSLASGEFSGEGILDGIVPGTISGTVTGSDVSAVLNLPAPTGGAYTLTTTGSVEESGSGEMSMSTAGSWVTPNGETPTGTFIAKRIRTYKEIEEEEAALKKKAEEEAKKRAKEAEEAKKTKEAEEAKRAKEAEEAKKTKEAEEAKEKEEQAKAALEQEQKQRAENEAKAAQVGKEKAEGEAKAAQVAKEAKEREEREKSNQPAGLNGKTLTVGGSGLVSLELSNPDDYSISGELTLTTASAGASHHTAKRRATILAAASYTISPLGSGAAKLRLSKGALAALRSHGTLHVVVTVTTRATGHSTIVKTHDLTLKGARR